MVDLMHLVNVFFVSLDPDQVLSLHEGRTVHHTSTIYVPVVDGTIPVSRDPGQDQPLDPGCVSCCIDPTPTLVEVDQDIGVLVSEDPGPGVFSRPTPASYPRQSSTLAAHHARNSRHQTVTSRIGASQSGNEIGIYRFADSSTT